MRTSSFWMTGVALVLAGAVAFTMVGCAEHSTEPVVSADDLPIAFDHRNVPHGARVWDEEGDAGDMPADAQAPSLPGKLDGITGTLATATDVDMYKLCLRGDFVASTARSLRKSGPEGDFAGDGADPADDSTLLLFDADGLAIAIGEDFDHLGSNWKAELEVSGLPAGEYYLAITSFRNRPLNQNGDEIFTEMNPETDTFTGTWGPDDSLQDHVLASWGHISHGESGDYTIALSRAQSCR